MKSRGEIEREIEKRARPIELARAIRIHQLRRTGTKGGGLFVFGEREEAKWNFTSRIARFGKFRKFFFSGKEASPHVPNRFLVLTRDSYIYILFWFFFFFFCQFALLRFPFQEDTQMWHGVFYIDRENRRALEIIPRRRSRAEVFRRIRKRWCARTIVFLVREREEGRGELIPELSAFRANVPYLYAAAAAARHGLTSFPFRRFARREERREKDFGGRKISTSEGERREEDDRSRYRRPHEETIVSGFLCARDFFPGDIYIYTHDVIACEWCDTKARRAITDYYYDLRSR